MGSASADLIVRGHVVVTRDPSQKVLSDGAVAVKGPRIVDIGPSDRVMAEYGHGAKVLTSSRALVMPGLVNTHTHIAMTCMRGLADDLPLMTWLREHIFPAEARLTGEMVYWGAMLGCAEMIRSGTTSFCDMYLFEHEVLRAADRAGLRGVLGEVLYDFPSPNYGPPEEGLKFTERLIEQYRGHERLAVAVEPHAPFTCSPDLLRAASSLARRLDAPLIIHLSETRDEVRTVRERYGVSPVHHLDGLGLLSPDLIAAHCVVLEDGEIDLLARRGVRVAHNPESNMKLASGVSPVPRLLAAGASVGLGTDGPASNNNLDLFGEMASAARLHKAFGLDPTLMAAETVLGMATDMGAAVLGLEGRVGRLAPGYLADLIVLDLDQPHLVPMYEPASHLVYAACGGDVLHTVVHGRVLMENRRLTTLDLPEIYGHVNDIARIMADAAGR